MTRAEVEALATRMAGRVVRELNKRGGVVLRGERARLVRAVVAGSLAGALLPVGDAASVVERAWRDGLRRDH